VTPTPVDNPYVGVLSKSCMELIGAQDIPKD
jgi:hypothetical protein